MGKSICLFRPLFFILILCSIYSSAHSDNHDPTLITTTNLAHEGKLSLRTKRPILILFSREGCPYCIQIKREILKPMLISGNYADKIIIREIILNSAVTLLNFNGSTVKASELAYKYSIEITPTLLFLGPNGKELAERIVGINTIDLFSYYVDQAIDTAALNFPSR
jgi:thioredoxin-related protein